MLRYVDRTGDCWTWTGAKTKAGYGLFTAAYTNAYAHVWLYEIAVGPVPDGWTLDHLCHDPDLCPGGDTCPHRSCCNPDHLTPKTRGDNVRRSSRWRAHDPQRASAVPR